MSMNVNMCYWANVAVICVTTEFVNQCVISLVGLT